MEGLQNQERLEVGGKAVNEQIREEIMSERDVEKEVRAEGRMKR